MTARRHRVLVALSGSLGALAALLSATDTSAFGMGDEQTALLAFGLAAIGVVATAVRQAWEQ